MHLFCDIVLIMTKPAKPVKFSQPESFEAALTELENIVVEMEAGQMPLEVSLLAHKRGARSCYNIVSRSYRMRNNRCVSLRLIH